jgi:hypothetical protein
MMANRAMVHLSQGVRHRAEGCVALRCNLASAINNPLGAPGLPPIWGAVGGDFLNPLYSWDQNGDQGKKTESTGL